MKTSDSDLKVNRNIYPDAVNVIGCVNLSISSLGIFGLSCSTFIEMFDDLAVDMGHRRYLISKLSGTIIPTTYYIFCRRNKQWNSPELLSI